MSGKATKTCKKVSSLLTTVYLEARAKAIWAQKVSENIKSYDNICQIDYEIPKIWAW